MPTTARLAPPFVRSDADALRHVLLWGPSPAIERGAPLHGEPSPIASRALEQFAILENRLAAFGVGVTHVDAPAQQSLGNSCADGAVMFDDGAFLMRPSDERRRGEIAALEATLTGLGVPIVGRIEAPGLLDGGDVLPAGDRVFIGAPHPRRSEFGIRPSVHGNALGREQFAAYVRSKGRTVVEVALAAEVVRLRSVAALVDEATLVLAPGLLDSAAFAGLETIEVPRGEDYAAGLLVLGNRRVLANLRFRETIPRLRKVKIAVDAIDLWEFGKLGITPSGLALALRRG